MRKLSNDDKAKLLDYIASEPEMNLFIYGDVETYGLDGDTCELYAQEDGDKWDSIVLRYLNYYTVYSKHDEYNAEAVANFLNSRKDISSVAGKKTVIDKLEKFFPNMRFSVTYMSRCNKAEMFRHKASGVTLRKITPDDAEAVVRLFCQIDEFKDIYVGREDEAIEEERVSLDRGATCCGFFAGNELVSYAQTSAENSMSAMIIGVATLPKWRGLGLASANVSALCRQQFEEGRKFVCLFYDNPAAGRIYNKVGFKEIGEYTLGRLKREGVQ